MRKTPACTPVVSMGHAEEILSPRGCRIKGERGFREGRSSRVVAAHHVCSGKRTIGSRVLMIQVDRPLCEPHCLCTAGRDLSGAEEKGLKVVCLGEGTERRDEISVELQSPLK